MDFLYKITKQKQDYRYEMKSEHYHDYYEFYYLLTGTRKMFLNEQVYRVYGGDLIAIPKGEIHRTSYLLEDDKTPTDCERIAVCFSELYIKELIHEIGINSLKMAFTNRQISIPNNRRAYFEELLDRMLEESKNVDEYSKILCRKHCEELILFVIRCQKISEQKVQPKEIEDEIILDAVQYINQNYEQELTLSFMAIRANMSVSYFSKRFKRITGFGFKEYLNTVRIRQACNLLLDTELTITQIAQACGYMDSNYFGDAFKKIKNLSPREYRKANIIY